MIFGKRNIEGNHSYLLCVVLLTVSMIIGCGNKQANSSQSSQAESVEKKEVGISKDSDTYVQGSTFVFSESFEKFSGMDEKRLSDYLKNINKEYADDVYVENGVVKVSADGQRAEHWKKNIVEKAKETTSILTSVSSKYRAEYSQSFDTVSIYHDLPLSFEDEFDYIGKAIVYCAMYQIFDGTEDFSVILNIYNCDTGKLLASGSVVEGRVTYDYEDWKRSYTLSAEEIEKLTSSDSEEYEVIKVEKSFTDGITVMEILQSTGGNDYHYAYLDESDALILSVDESQKAVMLENMEQFLISMKSQFEKLGDGYELTWNSGHSSIDLKFDDKLSKQDQTNYFIYSTTLCMLNQLLNEGSDLYYIDVNIYDSSSGELISTGNTVDGVSWNLGDE